MISFLEGQVIFKGERSVILNVGGVGFKVFLSQKTLNKIPREPENLKLFCYLNIGRNTMDLYGFLNAEELKFFEFLNDIPSIGPKAALEVASIASLPEIKGAIEKNDEKIVSQIYSIGKKKAQRIILEISRQLKEPHNLKEENEDDAIRALISLGFSRPKAKQALAKVPENIKDPAQKIKAALKILSR